MPQPVLLHKDASSYIGSPIILQHDCNNLTAELGKINNVFIPLDHPVQLRLQQPGPRGLHSVLLWSNLPVRYQLQLQQW